ncbi:MAG: hypothetical protein FD134_2275 [Gallionellaceae bacterium]|nr:MAG: hypothetical protein FD134_2275 [Gallionellaceae bacterium]
MADDNGSKRIERRAHHEVREVFVRACALLAPFFNGNSEAHGVSKFAMTHILGNHFPALSGIQAQIVITTVERLHRDGRLQSLLEQNADDEGAHG